LIAQGSKKGGNKNNKNKYQDNLAKFASSSSSSSSTNQFSKEVVKEAAMKAQALLSLIAFTKALLMRARKEAKLGKKSNNNHTMVAGINQNKDQLFETDADNEEDDDDDEDDQGNLSDDEDDEDDEDDDETDDNIGKSFDSLGNTFDSTNSNPQQNHYNADDDFLQNDEFGDFDDNQEAKPMGGRVITITPSKKPSYNDYSNDEDNTNSSGRVQVRRLGPSGGGGGALNDDEDLVAAMESLQRDLSAVGLQDSKPKRGWTRAWDV
jgi:hypothetical protein